MKRTLKIATHNLSCLWVTNQTAQIFFLAGKSAPKASAFRPLYVADQFALCPRSKSHSGLFLQLCHRRRVAGQAINFVVGLFECRVVLFILLLQSFDRRRAEFDPDTITADQDFILKKLRGFASKGVANVYSVNFHSGVL